MLIKRVIDARTNSSEGAKGKRKTSAEDKKQRSAEEISPYSRSLDAVPARQ